jgi:hypothetical protein
MSEPTRIEGNYEVGGDDLILFPVVVVEGEPGLIKLAGSDKETEFARTRWRVVQVGPDVQRYEPGDLVLVSGRVTKVLAQNLLAAYVTPFSIKDKAYVIVPEEEVKALVS